MIFSQDIPMVFLKPVIQVKPSEWDKAFPFSEQVGMALLNPGLKTMDRI